MSHLDSDPPYFYTLHVFICTSERPEGHPRPSCGRSGSESLRKWLKKQIQELDLETKVRINSAGCMNRCELGPTVVVYPEGIWYGIKTEEDVKDILEQHILKGKRVTRLMLPSRSH